MDIEDAGGSAEVAVVDALDEKAVEEQIGEVVERAGSIDVSFNAIGLGDTQGAPARRECRRLVGGVGGQYRGEDAAQALTEARQRGERGGFDGLGSRQRDCGSGCQLDLRRGRRLLVRIGHRPCISRRGEAISVPRFERSGWIVVHGEDRQP